MKIMFLIICCTIYGCSGAAARTTVCELAATASPHGSINVEVSGEVHGGLDRLLLSDRSCPTKSIALSISNSVVKRPSVAPLWAAIYRQGNIGTTGKSIHATVTGTYNYGASDWPSGVLTVEDVSGLEVESREMDGRQSADNADGGN